MILFLSNFDEFILILSDLIWFDWFDWFDWFLILFLSDFYFSLCGFSMAIVRKQIMKAIWREDKKKPSPQANVNTNTKDQEKNTIVFPDLNNDWLNRSVSKPNVSVDDRRLYTYEKVLQFFTFFFFWNAKRYTLFDVFDSN